jgi:hypothetical protein
MAATGTRKNDGLYALDDNGERIIPTGKWRCDHYRHCGCTGYDGSKTPGTCCDGVCRHAAWEHNE